MEAFFGCSRAALSPGASFAAQTAPWSRSQPGEEEGEVITYPICGVGADGKPMVCGWGCLGAGELQRFEQKEFRGSFRRTLFEKKLKKLCHEQQTLPGYQVNFARHLGSRIHKAIINASKTFEITKKHQQDEPGVDSGALSRSLASSRHRRPGLPGSLDCEPVQSVEAPRMLTASVSSNLKPTTTMSRLMKRARRATNKIQETCWGCILVVLHFKHVKW